MLLDICKLQLNYITQFCNHPETLFVAQQSFYILSRERLSKTVSQAPYTWRRTFIEQQYHAWQWPKDTTEIMDKRGLSHYRQSLSEYQDVRQQISNAMQSVFLFAQQHKLNIEIARQKLEKKFKILFNTDLDAINCLPISFEPHRHQEQLYLARTSLSSNWQINDMPAALSIQPLHQHPSLLNVLAWAVNNRLLTKATGLQLVDQRQKVKMALVLDLIQQLLQSPLITSAYDITTLDVNEVAEIDTILLFANLEHKAISSLNQQGLDLASLQTDPLNYANSKQSLIASVEGLIHSSWGHWHYVIYTGPTSLLELLGTIIQWQPHQKSAVEATCWCPSDNHGKKISQRIETVYSEVIAHYINHPLSGDYLITIADHFYRLQWQQGLVDILPLVKNKSLEQHLAEQRDIFLPANLIPY
jgi:adenylate cyclase